MPAIQPIEIVNAILDAFQDSNASAILVSSPTQYPRRFIVQFDDGESAVWIYIWTLTHGGRPNLPDEYRIQMTTIHSPLPLNPNGYTLLLGYEPNLKMYAGFDIQKHMTFTTGSPSVQIDIKCLHRALRDGLSFDRKQNNEIAVGFRPDQILHYMANAEDLHRFGHNATMSKLLSKAAALERITPSELTTISKGRKRIVSNISRLSRAANFRQQVLSAYSFRCAITRMQLRLVEAAHILPVGAEGSTDDVRNGLALSPTFHRAFDNALIYLDDNLIIRINPQKELQLKTLSLDGGLAEFTSYLNREIHLPADRRQWPNVNIIRIANKFRRVK